MYLTPLETQWKHGSYQKLTSCECFEGRDDPTGKGRKYPPKKKDETEQERKLRRSLKKMARKTETEEERAARKEAKNAKKQRKTQRKGGRADALPGARSSLSSFGGTEAPTTESHLDGDGGSDCDSSD